MLLDDIIIYSTLFFSLFTGIFFLSAYIGSNQKEAKKPKVKKYPKISIIMPAYNEGENIINSIKAALSVDYPKKEIIVVDDESTDDTLKKARKMSSKEVRVFTKKHSGKAGSVNFGIKKASGDIIMVLDADTYPDKNCLKEIVPYFENPKIMAALPVIKIHEPKNIIEKCQVVEYSIMAFLKRTFYFIGSMNCTPAGAFIRKSFLKKYGGFDEGNITEDFEMGLRIQSKNYQIAQSFESQVYTIVPRNLKKLLRQRVRWSYGTLKNISDYKFMISRLYGDLGLFIIPISVFSIGLISFIFVYFLLRLFQDILHKIYLNSLIGFDIWGKIRIEKINLLSLITDEKTFFIFFTMVAGILLYEMGRRSIKEKFRLSYIFYLLFYGWVMGLSQAIAVWYFIRGKKPQW